MWEKIGEEKGKVKKFAVVKDLVEGPTVQAQQNGEEHDPLDGVALDRVIVMFTQFQLFIDICQAKKEFCKQY